MLQAGGNAAHFSGGTLRCPSVHILFVKSRWKCCPFFWRSFFGGLWRTLVFRLKAAHFSPKSLPNKISSPKSSSRKMGSSSPCFLCCLPRMVDECAGVSGVESKLDRRVLRCSDANSFCTLTLEPYRPSTSTSTWTRHCIKGCMHHLLTLLLREHVVRIVHRKRAKLGTTNSHLS